MDQSGNDRLQELENQVQHLTDENEQLRQQLDDREQGRKKKRKKAEQLGRSGARLLLGGRLKKSILQLYDEIPSGDVRRETLAEVTANIIARLTRVGFVGLLFALLPAVMVIAQTILLSKQNRLISEQQKFQEEVSKQQNAIMETQNNLILRQIKEAEEATQQTLFASRLANLKRLIRDAADNRRKRNRELNGAAIAEMASFTKTLEPSELERGPNESQVEVSPEKGDLLKTLVAANLAEDTYQKIFGDTDFSYAYLQQADLHGAYLQNVNLNNAYLILSKLREADLQFIQLKGAFLRGAFFTRALLGRANLTGVDAQDASFNQAKLISATLSAADLRGADLREADLRQSTLHGANLAGALLDGARVDSPDWFGVLQQNDVQGLKRLLEQYRVEETAQKDENGQDYYRIIRKGEG